MAIGFIASIGCAFITLGHPFLNVQYPIDKDDFRCFAILSAVLFVFFGTRVSEFRKKGVEL